MGLKILLWLASKQIIVLAVCCSWQSKHFRFHPVSFLSQRNLVCVYFGTGERFSLPKKWKLKKKSYFCKNNNHYAEQKYRSFLKRLQ